MSGAPAAVHDDELRRRVISKVAWRLSPFLGLLYLVNYLDRVNLAFAGPNGLKDDLGLTEQMFGLAAGLFFAGYLVLEVPSNLALHRFGARRWIARILVTWGIVASCIAFVPNAGWLYALRFLLGIAEAGFFPGIILYLTFWFPERERAKAVALFMVAVPLSTVLGAPLSSLLIEYGHGALFGLDGWRFMFLVEGLPAIVLGVIAWFYLTDRPRDAAWLTAEERTWLAAEIEGEQSRTARDHPLGVRHALLNGRVWALGFVYFGVVYGLYAVGFFLPTIIDGFSEQFGTDYSVVQAGLITAIPYTVGAIAMVLWARHGDRTRERFWHVALPAIVGGLAIPVALYLSSPLLTMLAVTVCAAGVCCALPTFWPLPSMFLTGAAAAGGIALINSIGNSAGFLAPYVTGWMADLTGSQKAGLWIVGACMIGSGLLALVLKGSQAPEPGDGPAAPREKMSP